MSKILEYKLGDLRGVLSSYKDGYSYKIYYKNIRKSQVIGQSYVYLYDKDETYKRMLSDMKQIAGITKDLFDLEKLWYNNHTSIIQVNGTYNTDSSCKLSITRNHHPHGGFLYAIIKSERNLILWNRNIDGIF